MITRQRRHIRENQQIQDHKRTCITHEKCDEVAEYIELNAEAVRLYRKNHPEKCVRAFRGSIVKSSGRKICECRRSAKKRDIQYELTDEQSKELICDKCFYCGYQPTACQFNGIDRLDHKQNYVFKNCVTACSMCNYMKACHSSIVFLDICEHILTYLGKIKGNLHPQLFLNFNVRKSFHQLYEGYKKSANKRELEWMLSTDELSSIIKQPCYLCGKLTTNEHTNGVDRYDNNLGYIISNTRPCCGTCNYLKRDANYDVFINKLTQIHSNRELTLPKLSVMNSTNDEKRTPT
jgi:hypothetical protein